MSPTQVLSLSLSVCVKFLTLGPSSLFRLCSTFSLLSSLTSRISYCIYNCELPVQTLQIQTPDEDLVEELIPILQNPGPLHRHQGGNAVGRLDPQSLPREHDPHLDLFAEKSEIGEDGGEHPANIMVHGGTLYVKCDQIIKLIRRSRTQMTLTSHLLHQPSLSPPLLQNNSDKPKPKPPSLLFRHRCLSLPELTCLGFPIPIHSVSPVWTSRFPLSRCEPENSAEFELDQASNLAFEPTQILNEKETSFVKILKEANSILPQVVLASTILALLYPPSFTWFTSRYYAPALGFLMFAVGVNSSEKDFLEAFNRPAAILAGYVGQFVVKPLLGCAFGTIAMTIFGLPTSLGAGIMLTSCVSGAQLSNYATFLTDPQMAPLSIVMTSFSTASAVLVTPILSLLLIGKRLPVDVKGMVSSIMQIVVTPIAAGLLLNRFFPQICNAIRPLLPPLSVFVTALCVGAPLAINIDSVMSPFGASVLLLVIAFHLSAFIAGYSITGLVFQNAPDMKALQRTLSYETGMQSSLLALALANRFFQDPLVGVPPAISVVIMSLMGFSLVMLWAKKKN